MTDTRLRWRDIQEQDLFSKEALEPILSCTCGDCYQDARQNMFMDLQEAIYPNWVDRWGRRYIDKLNWQEYMETADDQWIDSQAATYIAKLKTIDKIARTAARRVGQYTRFDIDFDYCWACGHVKKLDGGKAVKRGGRITWVCSDCMPHYFRACDCCNEMYDMSEVHRMYVHDEETNDYEQQYVCSDCLNQHYIRCYACGDWMHKNNSMAYHGHYDGTTNGYDPDCHVHLCERCASPDSDRERWSCEECGDTYFRWELESHDDDCMYCPDCWEKYRVIRPWEWKPAPHMKCSSNNPKWRSDRLMFGTEVEIEQEPNAIPTWQVAELILDYWGGESEIYVKCDATINRGVEIVTHPFSWGRYREDRDRIRKFFDALRSNGYGADEFDNVGMHVHMSKNAFTRFHLYKFLTFLYSTPHRTFIHEIAGRYNHDYALWNVSDVDPSGIKSNAKRKHNCSDERHAAVNLCGEDTIEIRIFKSTVLHDIYGKNLEFCNSVYEFTKKSKTSNITIPHYFDWLTSKYNANRYRYLIEFLSGNQTIREDFALFNDSEPQQKEE